MKAVREWPGGKGAEEGAEVGARRGVSSDTPSFLTDLGRSPPWGSASSCSCVLWVSFLSQGGVGSGGGRMVAFPSPMVKSYASLTPNLVLTMAEEAKPA